jgi:hypothetical protein
MNAHVKQKVFVIEDCVPLPARKWGPGSRKDPNSLSGVLRRLEVGQSIFLAGKKHSSGSGLGSRLSKLKPKKFAQRAVDGGLRVWRTA